MALAIHRPGDGIVICTRPVLDPPPPNELERRCAAGCLPCPACLALRPPPPAGAGAGAGATGATGEKSNGEPAMPLSERDARQAEKFRLINSRDRQRQARNRALLRSHHVPLVPFVTSAERPAGTRAPVPTLEESEEILARSRCIMQEGDYVMCRGFEPSPWQYRHSGDAFGGARVRPAAQLALERMYGADVAPPSTSPPLLNYWSTNTSTEEYI